MNILFISTLSGRNSVGPSWSVPARIKALARYDNILWINLSESEMPHWKEIPFFHKISEYGQLSLNNLPIPFNNPDIVVCENFYSMDEVWFARELKKRGISYIVVPRGSLSKAARNNGKWLKKYVAHKLWFDKYVKDAAAVQFLTEVERDSSTVKDINSFVLPNGFYLPQKHKIAFSDSGINCVFIGRIDIYQKGLDLLLGAINLRLDILRVHNVTFNLYGPQSHDTDKLNNKIKELGLDDIVKLKGEVSGVKKEEVLLLSDVFLLTSRSEGHPMGLVEALAYGVPCLVSKGSNMSKEIEFSDSGWACEGDSAESIAEAIDRMIIQKRLFASKSKNALALAKEYEWDKLAKQFHDKLEELI